MIVVVIRVVARSRSSPPVPLMLRRRASPVWLGLNTDPRPHGARCGHTWQDRETSDGARAHSGPHRREAATHHGWCAPCADRYVKAYQARTHAWAGGLWFPSCDLALNQTGSRRERQKITAHAHGCVGRSFRARTCAHSRTLLTQAVGSLSVRPRSRTGPVRDITHKRFVFRQKRVILNLSHASARA
jgi:hypothetical protein